MPEEDLHATEVNHAEEVLDEDFRSFAALSGPDREAAFFVPFPLRQEALHRTEELSDDVPAAIEKYIYWRDPSGRQRLGRKSRDNLSKT